MNKLKYIKAISFDELFNRWYEREGVREEWQKVAVEKGFSDWKSWRMSYLEEFGMVDLKWGLYEIDNSLMREFFVGPYSSWKAFYEDRQKSTFEDICDKVESINKVKSILESFPAEMEFIGVTDGARYMLIEGHHRASAIAIAMKKGIKVESVIRMVMADIEKAEFDKLMTI